MTRDPKLLMAVAGVVVLAIIAVLVVLFPRNNPGGEIKQNLVRGASVENDRGYKVITKTQQYEIVYEETTDRFIIITRVIDFTTARAAAETAFLSLVDNKREIACALNVQIQLPLGSNPQLVYIPLSFCSN